MFELMDTYSQNSAVIKVIGIGGGGGNALEHMVSGSIDGVEFVCANTDAQALKSSSAKTVLQLGNHITKGLGAGANPDVGRQAALEERDRIVDAGTVMPTLRAERSASTWHTVIDMSDSRGLVPVLLDPGLAGAPLTACSGGGLEHGVHRWSRLGAEPFDETFQPRLIESEQRACKDSLALLARQRGGERLVKLLFAGVCSPRPGSAGSPLRHPLTPSSSRARHPTRGV